MDFEIPADFKDIIGMAREFARAEVRPAEVAIDRIADPSAAFTSDVHRSITRQLYALGFHKLSLPEQVGGLGLPSPGGFFVQRELAYAGAGLASQMLVTPIAAGLISALELGSRHRVYREYLEQYVEDVDGQHSSAWTITEPDAGSDIFSFGRPDIGFRVRAIPSAGGHGWVINGAKAAWCTNGWLADSLILMAAIETNQGMEGTGTFLIPFSWGGISRGKPIDKLGLRALNQADLFFEHCEVPGEFLIVPPGPSYAKVFNGFVTSGNTSVGNLALSVAKAAYDEGMKYARERKQGGSPIIEHQIVAKKLFDAFRVIEAADLMLQKSAWLISRQQGRPELAFAARVQACDALDQVSRDMMLLHGANGITKEYRVEKFYRDAGPLRVMDGTTDRVALKGAGILAQSAP
jgi:alkylation response protein AidB-like acyl-CoA dehydrogenase